MLFPRCRSVHTFGMRYAVSVVSLDARHTVRGIRVLGPKRVLLPRPRTRHVVEAAPGIRVSVGDRFVPTPSSEI